MSIFGSSGPVVAKDTLRSSAALYLVELISEGPVKGLVTNDSQSIYLQNVPISNADGTVNYIGCTTDFRGGYVDQTAVGGFMAAEEEMDVNQKVWHTTPLVESLTNPDYTHGRLVFNIPALQAENIKTGNVYADTISFMIEVQYAGGDWQDAGFGTINIYGKCTSNYQKQYQFELPRDPSGNQGPWLIRITKLTADSTDTNNSSSDIVLTNDLYLQSIVGTIQQEFTYPRSAVASVAIDAQYFGTSLPARSYYMDGMIVSVPSNYDPDTRTYTGLWDGTFKSGYTNCPPWIFYDMLTNNVYGLGQYIDASQVDKYGLYQIAQYCDQMVPDGYGGLEPRFTFNRQIKDAKEAIEALAEVAGTFRAMPYWSSGAVMLSQDAPADPVLLVTPANTIDGNISYTSTALKARHTTAVVKWTNPALNYEDDYESIDDPYAINRYGYREMQIEALGCTSRGQARRLGLWAVTNELTNTQSVTYRAGYDHAVIMPGDIVEIQDPALSNADYGGRLLFGSNARFLLLDRLVTLTDWTKASVSVLLPDGSIGTSGLSAAVKHLTVDEALYGADAAMSVSVASAIQRDPTSATTNTPDSLDTTADSATQVSLDDGAKLFSVVVLSEPFNQDPSTDAIWVLYTPASEVATYRVIGKKEVDRNVYEINAVQHTPEIYASIDAEFLFDPDVGSVGSTVVQPPAVISFRESFFFNHGAYRQVLTVSWSTPTTGVPVVGYNLSGVGPNGNFSFPNLQTNSHTLYNVPIGDFSFSVTSIGANGAQSVPTSATTTVQGWGSAPVPSVTNLALVGGNNGQFLGSSANISWTNDIGSSPQYPVTNIVRVSDGNGNLLRVETLNSTQYSYTLDLNTADGGPRRVLRFDVTGVAPSGQEGPVASLTATNNPPSAVSPLVQAASGQVVVSYTQTEPDIVGAQVWVSADPGFDPHSNPPTYDGRNNPVGLPFGPGTYRVWVALYDAMGEVALNISAATSITLS